MWNSLVARPLARSPTPAEDGRILKSLNYPCRSHPCSEIARGLPLWPRGHNKFRIPCIFLRASHLQACQLVGLLNGALGGGRYRNTLRLSRFKHANVFEHVQIFFLGGVLVMRNPYAARPQDPVTTNCLRCKKSQQYSKVGNHRGHGRGNRVAALARGRVRIYQERTSGS